MCGFKSWLSNWSVTSMVKLNLNIAKYTVVHERGLGTPVFPIPLWATRVYHHLQFYDKRIFVVISVRSYTKTLYNCACQWARWWHIVWEFPSTFKKKITQDPTPVIGISANTSIGPSSSDLSNGDRRGRTDYWKQNVMPRTLTLCEGFMFCDVCY